MVLRDNNKYSRRADENNDQYILRTKHHINADRPSSKRYGSFIDVGTTLCAYRV